MSQVEMAAGGLERSQTEAEQEVEAIISVSMSLPVAQCDVLCLRRRGRACSLPRPPAFSENTLSSSPPFPVLLCVGCNDLGVTLCS